MGNEPSKRSMTKTGGHDVSVNNGQHIDTVVGDKSSEVSGVHSDSNDLGKIDILQSDSNTTTAKTLLEVANGLHLTDNVSSISAVENLDNTVQDNVVSNSVTNDDIRESSTDSQTETNAPSTGNMDDQTVTPPTTPRKDTPTTPGRDDSGVESSSDIVQVGSGGSKDSGTKSKVSKKSKKLDDNKKIKKSTSEININESIEDEVVSSKKDKKKKLKKKISKQNSTVSDVGMTSTVSMSSGLNISSVSSDAGRGTLERSVSSVEPGFVVMNSKENKKPRRPLSKSFSDIEQQKEKKKKKKVDKKKSSVVAPAQVENTNKEKRRSIFEEDFTIELGLAEENLDVVSLSSLSSDNGDFYLDNENKKGHQKTTDKQLDTKEAVELPYRSTSKSSITLKDSQSEINKANQNNDDHIVYERKITVIKHEPVLSEIDKIDTSEENNNIETETKEEISLEEMKTDALKQLSIDYSSEGEGGNETVDDVLANYSLVDQIVANISREYCCAPQGIITDRNKNGVRRIGHSQSMSPAEGGKLHRPVRRQFSEDVTRTRFSNTLGPDGFEGGTHDHSRRVILTRPLSVDYPSSSSSSAASPLKPSKKRQNSFSEMLKKSTTAFTHHRKRSDSKGETPNEQNVKKTGDGQATSIVYM